MNDSNDRLNQIWQKIKQACADGWNSFNASTEESAKKKEEEYQNLVNEVKAESKWYDEQKKTAASNSDTLKKEWFGDTKKQTSQMKDRAMKKYDTLSQKADERAVKVSEAMQKNTPNEMSKKADAKVAKIEESLQNSMVSEPEVAIKEEISISERFNKWKLEKRKEYRAKKAKREAEKAEAKRQQEAEKAARDAERAKQEAIDADTRKKAEAERKKQEALDAEAKKKAEAEKAKQNAIALKERREREAAEAEERRKREVEKEKERLQKEAQAAIDKQQKEKEAEEARIAKQKEKEAIAAAKEKAKIEKQLAEEKAKAEKAAQKQAEEARKREDAKIKEAERQKLEEAKRIERQKQAEEKAIREAEIAQEKKERAEKEKAEKEKQREDAKRLKEEKDRVEKERKAKEAEAKRADKEFKERVKAEKKKEAEMKKLEAKKKKNSRLDDRRANKKLDDLKKKINGSPEDEAAAQAAALVDLKAEAERKNKKNIFTQKFSTHRSKTSLIIEIKEFETHIAEVKVIGTADMDTKSVVLTNVVTIPTPAGTFMNGRITEIDKLAYSIVEAMMTNGISSRDVTFISNDAGIVEKTVTNVAWQKSDKVNMELVKTLALQNMTFTGTIEDYVVRYKVLEKHALDGSEKPEFSLNIDMNSLKQLLAGKPQAATIDIYMMPKIVEETYRKLATTCDLTLKNLDIAVNGLSNFIKREYREGDNISIEIGERVSSIIVSSNGDILSNTRFPYGYMSIEDKFKEYNNFVLGTDLDQILSRIKEDNLFDDNKLDEFIINKGMGMNEANDLITILDGVKSGLATILEQVEKSIRGLSGQYTNLDVHTATLFCDRDAFPDLREDFATALGLELVIPESYLWITSTELNRSINVYRDVIGTSLDPMNFKDSTQELSKDAERKLNIISVGIIVLGVGIAISGVVVHKMYQSSKTTEKVSLEAQLSSAKEAERIEKKYKLALQALDTITTFNTYTSNTDRISELIGTLEEITPKSIVYTGITCDETALVLSIESTSRVDIIKLIDELERIEGFDSIETTGYTISEDEMGTTKYIMAFNCVFHVEPVVVPEPETEAESETESSDDLVE